jgi:predicted nuclease of restriction endonuclease-like (RecB) superfamily
MPMVATLRTRALIRSLMSNLLCIGQSWTDVNNQMVLTVPGNNYFVQQNRDPYQDLVYLAKDLGLSGVDIGKVKKRNSALWIRSSPLL